ncbi:hypothetical protein NPIL_566451 [Nephila pilipes]|uniref:Uncharacterized protein n=1 Tax=Nephila pilipes TaxID=299642 RepID=A0A8X6MBZ0_NEPPI|nr:hypothetical protein NPIL_566451 [Nephila pilipes]
MDSSDYIVKSENCIAISSVNSLSLHSYETIFNRRNNPFIYGFVIETPNIVIDTSNPFIDGLDWEENESEASLDEAKLLPQPVMFQDSPIPVNPFTNPFFDLLSFTDPLADLEEEDADFLCYKWILAHQHLFHRQDEQQP